MRLRTYSTSDLMSASSVWNSSCRAAFTSWTRSKRSWRRMGCSPDVGSTCTAGCDRHESDDVGRESRDLDESVEPRLMGRILPHRAVPRDCGFCT
jgi:hypothetical protein